MAKIMLVEDDNNLREIYGARLLAEGHEIVTAKDGEEALAIAVKEKPELIISDVMMPKISGFDMLDILRNAPETKFTKVIMMTALSQTEDKARADSLGADRYLVKSQVTLEDVARVVRDVLDGKTETDSNTTPVVTTAEGTTESSSEAIEAPVVESSPEPTVNLEVSDPEPPALAVQIEPIPTPAIEATPEIVPVSEPVIASPTTPDPVTDVLASTQIATPPPTLPATPVSDPMVTDDIATPVADTPQPAPVPQFNVQLPSMQPTTPAEAPAETPAPITLTPEPSQESQNIGPNLMEALQQEADKPAEEPNSVEPTNITPTVINGAEDTLVTPTAPEIEETPDPVVAEVAPSEEIAEITNPLSEEVRKKGIIQPLNDITTGPDMNALLDAEEKKAPVQNPPVNTVISPAGTAPEVPGGPPAPTSEHDIISL